MPEASLFGAPARYAGGVLDLGAGVHAWLQPNGSWGESNAGLIAGDGASVLVDTLWDVALTRRMLDAMEPLTRAAPIEVVVNTHSDGDHWWGNELLADRRIVTSAASAKVMAGTNVRELQRFRSLAGALRAGARLPVPGRAKLAQVGGYFGAMMAPYDWSAIELTQPTEIFDERTLLSVGGRELGLHRVGPAHTPGDLIVHVPDAGVVLCADIGFIGSTPVMWAGPAERWIAAIDRVLELEPERIVPGHGPVTDADGMNALRDYWSWLLQRARPRFDAGEAPGAAARAIALSSEFAAMPWAGWENPERIAINCHTQWAHFDGRAPSQGARHTVEVFRQAALLAGELRGRRPARDGR